jgi:hypothetical protein
MEDSQNKRSDYQFLHVFTRHPADCICTTHGSYKATNDKNTLSLAQKPSTLATVRRACQEWYTPAHQPYERKQAENKKSGSTLADLAILKLK